MLGHGFYNRHSQEQGLANQRALPLLLQAVDALDPARLPGGVNIADYGSAQGRNSLEPLRQVVERLQQTWDPAPPISVIHTDLPGNDWNSLFNTVLHSPDSYLAGREGVYSLASGASVYSPILPPASVALGYSAVVEHWLSRAPGPISGHIWSPRAGGGERAAWAAQAGEDWRDFLSLRGAELIPSGRLLLVLSGADGEGLSGAEGLMDLVNQVLTEMVAAGELSGAEYAAMAIPTYYRTRAEWLAPWEEPAFAQATGLEVLHFEEFALDDVYLAQYQDSGDAEAFARDYAGFFSAAFEPALFQPLDPGRGPAGREQVIAAFGGRLHSALAQDPAAFSARWWMALMLLTKG